MIDSDTNPEISGKNLRLPFASSEAELVGIRVTRAEFSRLMGCSRQCVTDWVKSGRIVLGADGRMDPRQAVASILKTGDPARLRAKVLAPLLRDVGRAERRIAELEAGLCDARDDADFHEGAAAELIEVIDAFKTLVAIEWRELRALDPAAAIAAITAWFDRAMHYNIEAAGCIGDPVFREPDHDERSEEEGEEGAGIV